MSQAHANEILPPSPSRSDIRDAINKKMKKHPQMYLSAELCNWIDGVIRYARIAAHFLQGLSERTRTNTLVCSHASVSRAFRIRPGLARL
ncbi:hypothetical protein EVAR_16681_1 [Eumeta japonica]|uniref:Uncharacterized protein n=1 Tax=Eumeta variegata TaxID=151549 RepID=A0A4C1V621_EUMVA|nr:hypothetical protein EVAR_16681_1 [Eumeta japonica]